MPLTPGMFGYSILRSTYRNDFFTSLFDGMKKLGVPLRVCIRKPVPVYMKRPLPTPAF